MPDRVRIDGPVDVGYVRDENDRLIISPTDPIQFTDYVTVQVDSGLAMATGDALGIRGRFTGLPTSGVIHSITAMDLAKQSINFDIVFFDGQPNLIASNVAYDPDDAALRLSQSSVLIDTWKAFADSSQGVKTNIGLPYVAPNGELWFQCVTRGTPTFATVNDFAIRLGIIK